MRAVRVGIDMSTARLTGSGGGTGGEDSGVSKDAVVAVTGVLEGTSGAVGGAMNWCPLP